MSTKPPGRAARNWSIVTAAVLTLCACAKSESPRTETHAATGSAAAAATGQAGGDVSGDEVGGTLNAAGIPTTYTAHFENGQLARIAELRNAAQAGEYRFYGARVTRYTGPPLGGGTSIDVEFDLQGTIASAKRADGTGAEIPTEEISAILTRAQLLRSHAMTQRSVKSHQPH